VLGIVGFGQFGSAFVPLFKAHPLVDRIALCDMEPERVKKFAEDPFIKEKLSEKDLYYSFKDEKKIIDILVEIEKDAKGE